LQEVVAVFVVDVALEHACAEFRSQAADGQITVAERDLLIDGAILLAVKIEELMQDARAGLPPAWTDAARGEAGVLRAAPSASGTTGPWC
jgi:hypothetical protein